MLHTSVISGGEALGRLVVVCGGYETPNGLGRARSKGGTLEKSSYGRRETDNLQVAVRSRKD